MRLNGEISHREGEGEGEEEAENEVGSSQKVVVGYALTSKKKKSFLQPKFLSFARNKGIFFVAIDLNKPLLEQGPFDVVLHKLSGKEWREVIEHFRNKPINQVAKPLVVDGTAKSHELFLAYDEFSLSELEPPLVLQEFVNHGGLLFKIYIVGETIKVVRRFSLPNISEHELSKVDGLFRFPRVSCAAASADEAYLDPTIAEHPPRSLLERLAGELRRRLGLHLFNIDMIREYGTKNVFYVIDINYFPGYGKMPDYEHVFTDFLLSLVQNKFKKKPDT